MTSPPTAYERPWKRTLPDPALSPAAAEGPPWVTSWIHAPARTGRFNRWARCGDNRPGRAPGRADDADRQRLLLAERATDGGHRRADDEVLGRAQRQRAQGQPAGVDLQERHVREGVEAEHLRRNLVAVLEAHEHLPCLADRGALPAGDDVRVRRDLAVARDHEARAQPALCGAPRAGVALQAGADDGDDAGRLALVDARRVEAALLRAGLLAHLHPRGALDRLPP